MPRSVTQSGLSHALGQATEPTLAVRLFEEAAKLEEAFALRKWQSTELDGGRFAEVAARIIYGVDSGKFNLSKGVDDCLRYVENPQVTHAFPDLQSANQLALILRATYKLRSQRGAVHVSPTYTANEIDSRMVVEGVRWVLAELLRVFVTTDQSALVTAVEELSRFPHPLIRQYGGQPLLQSISLTAEEEVLVHLLNERTGMTQAQLIRAIPKDPSGVRRAVKHLADGRTRQIVGVGDRWEITDLGIVRAEARLLLDNAHK
ncbi:MAG TPA: hypothetical protein DGG94_02955 [Micromonosporaceae bacterium]|nr:hypothetical protein [Micromonosporaceae bacterium]HCU48776.1 hypothetical protein [Micromonosporaceae bacterium]